MYKMMQEWKVVKNTRCGLFVGSRSLPTCPVFGGSILPSPLLCFSIFSLVPAPMIFCPSLGPRNHGLNPLKPWIPFCTELFNVRNLIIPTQLELIQCLCNSPLRLDSFRKGCFCLTWSLILIGTQPIWVFPHFHGIMVPLRLCEIVKYI